MSKPYCSAVNAGLFVNVDGLVGLCCSGDGNLGNIRRSSIDDIFKTEKFIRIKNNLESGDSDEYCRGCDETEIIAPGASQRTAFNTQFPDTVDRKLQLLDIRWSNVCNLSCRYCGPNDSSEWRKLHSLPIETVNKTYIDSLFDEIARHRNTIESVYLLGGEPLLQKHNERLLDTIKPDVKIDIITNMSVGNLKNNKIYQKLTKMPMVHWNISFDNVGDRFEYVRQGAKWPTFTDNINRLCDDFGGHRVGFHPVYHIWNAHNLSEYYEYASTGNFRVKWQLALPRVDSQHKFKTDSFRVFGHNQKIISRAIQEINLLGVDNQILNGIRQSLESDVSIPQQGTKFLNWTARMEQFMPPAKTFGELWPELNTLLTA